VPKLPIMIDAEEHSCVKTVQYC